MINKKISTDKSLVWVLQIIFGVLIARTPFLYDQIIFSPIENYLCVLALITAYVVTLWSWLDFSHLMSMNVYNRYDLIDMFRFLMDLIIVIIYILLFLSIQFISISESIWIYLIWFPLIFLGYVFSGLPRIMKYGKIASRIKLLYSYTAIFSALFLIYIFSDDYLIQNLGGAIVNTITVSIFLITYISYRVMRRKIKARREQEKKEKGLTIGIDIDGVLANQIEILLPIINAKYNVQLSYEDINDWRFEIKNTDIAKLIIEYQEIDSIILNMALHKDAKLVIDDLYESHIIDIVTARTKSTTSSTKKWLKQNEIKYDDFINLKEGGKSLHEMDVLIDDYPGNIEEFLENSDGYAILFDQPWNRDESRRGLIDNSDNDRLFIAETWSHVALLIQYIESHYDIGV